MSETTSAAPEAANNPYEIVRVSGPSGHESMRRVIAESLKADGYEVLEGEVAVDGFGYPLPHKPRTDLAGNATTRTGQPTEAPEPVDVKASAKTSTTKEK